MVVVCARGPPSVAGGRRQSPPPPPSTAVPIMVVAAVVVAEVTLVMLAAVSQAPVTWALITANSGSGSGGNVGPLLVDPYGEQGYYSFVKAEDYDHPPRVRKPPYHRTAYRCPERLVDGRLSPKDTLCGDLNRGLVPMNPMGQRPVTDPYPFELIKNKTLEFLSRSLPFLKKQTNLPKVARLAAPVASPPIGALASAGPGYRFRRSIATAETSSVASASVRNDSGAPTPPERRDSSLPDYRRTALSRENVHRFLNATLNGLCLNAHGTLCTVLHQLQQQQQQHPQLRQLLRRERSSSSAAMLNALAGLLSLAKQSPTVNKIQSSESTATTASSSSSSGSGSAGGAGSGGVASGGAGGSGNSASSTAANLLNVLSYAGEILSAVSQDSTTPAPVVTRSPLSQVLSALTGASGNSASSSSPIVQVLDLMTSESSPVKLLANIYASSRLKKQAEAESFERPSHAAGHRSGSVDRPSGRSGGTLPPTPCPSMEEYVTPVYARNYQGVWKYVVQIPQEGYLTQTIQQTACMSQTCDFVEGGVCHESPRWVSLLVAEIFYPDALVTPTGARPPPPPPPPPPRLPPHHPSYVRNAHAPPTKPAGSAGAVVGSLDKPIAAPSARFPSYKRPLPPDLSPPPAIEDFHNFQQYLQRRVAESNGFRLRRSRREIREGSVLDEPLSNRSSFNLSQGTTNTLPDKATPAGGKRATRCDGYDKVGCFVVRMYYDWFLVNGSCKCWKPSAKRVARRLFAG